MIDQNRIVLTPEEIERCREFAQISSHTQQAVEFGQHSTKERPVSEISRDTLIGKLAETAFSKILRENYGVEAELDFNYYPRGKWDDQDAEINEWRIDVKGTRQGGHWLLIEWNKLCFRQINNNMSHVFVMFSVGWDRASDTPTGCVRYEGAVSLDRLNQHSPTTRLLRKGDVIPGTHAVLQADNYAVHFDDLNRSLDQFVEYILSHTPPDTLTGNYINPYSGKTTTQIQAEKGKIIAPCNACDDIQIPSKKHGILDIIRALISRFLR